MTAPSSARAAKSALRAQLLQARRAVPAWVREEEAHALAEWLIGLSGTVCAYVPVGVEPGSVDMLDTLVQAGCTVLLPVVIDEGPLDWAPYSGAGSLAPARFGLLEPVGPRLGRLAVSEADCMLVPALAADRYGVRLGRGGGHYDRTLPLADPTADLIAVVRDGELLEALPREPHDWLVNAVLTPSAGFTALPR